MAESFSLDGHTTYKWAVTVTGETLENVTFVRNTGFDIGLWIKGTLGGVTVLVPKTQIARVHN